MEEENLNIDKKNQNNENQLPTEDQTIEELLARVEDLEKEKEQYLDNLKRAKNDVLRIQNEFEQKFQEFQEMANADLIYRLLSILDSFELAFEKANLENEILKGFYLIYAQLKDILEKYGLSEINPLGQKFDPNFHEAIAVKECETKSCDASDDNKIVEVLSMGYLYRGRVLRPARVKVISH